MPTVDVLMTVRNGERFLLEAVESIQRQKMNDWRLIVVDDASTDSTPQLLSGLATRDARLVALRGEGRGVAAAANVGLTMVSAPFVMRMDADDVSMPDRMQQQVARLLDNPKVVAVGSYVQLIDEAGRPLRIRRAPLASQDIRRTLMTRNCICHPSSMIRTSALREIGGYRPKFKNSLDYDLWLRLSEVGDIENSSEVLLQYRRHQDQISGKRNQHRQTLYSVAAATDFFFRRLHETGVEVQIDEECCSDLVAKICLLYKADLVKVDIAALNRHAIRLLRFARCISLEDKTRLERSMRPHLSLMERGKHLLYSLGRRTHGQANDI